MATYAILRVHTTNLDYYTTMKLKALILLLSGVLDSVSTILFGNEDQRLIEEKDEQRTLVYVALKTLRNAETYAQVLDALGFYSEAMDFVQEDHTDLVEKVADLKTWVAELQGDKRRSSMEAENLTIATNSNFSIIKGLREDMKGMQRMLSETQNELAETRKVNEKLNKLVSQYEWNEVYG